MTLKKWLFPLGIAFLCMPQLHVQAADTGTNKIHFINMKSSSSSGSDAIILESNGKFALIDAGEDYDFPTGEDSRYPAREGIATNIKQVLEDRLMRRLEELGVKRLEFVIGTHVHSDHIGGLDEVLAKYPVGRLYLKRYSDDRIEEDYYRFDNLFNYENALAEAQKQGVPVIQDITAEQAHFTFGDMDLQLYNYENEYDAPGQLHVVEDDNTNSIVTVITVNGQKIYLGGDLDESEEKESLYGPQIGNVNLMKFNHHRDVTISNTKTFVGHLSPDLIVQTSTEDPMKSGVVDTDYIKWLEQQAIPRIKAAGDDYDATVFSIDKDGIHDITTTYSKIPTYEEKWIAQDGQWYYQLSTGEHPVGWYQVGDNWYYFNSKGILQASEWVMIDGMWTYFTDATTLAGGWTQIDGKWYFFNKEGQMLTGLIEDHDNLYYMGDNGQMTVGLVQINDEWYFFNPDGHLDLEGAPRAIVRRKFANLQPSHLVYHTNDFSGRPEPRREDRQARGGLDRRFNRPIEGNRPR